MTNKVVAIIQVRMGSSRLPGKVLKTILGKPILELIVERLKSARSLDQIVVATTTQLADDQIEAKCRQVGVTCFRGSENDVTGRVLAALKEHSATVAVEIYGDCPFVDPAIVDQFVRFYQAHDFDFVSNDLKTTYPPGLEVEVYRVEALEDSASRTSDPAIREHGTLFIRQHPDLYRLHNIEAPDGLRFPDIFMELDTEEDFKVISAVYKALYPQNPRFSAYDVVNFLVGNPDLVKLNQDVHRRWKEFREK